MVYGIIGSGPVVSQGKRRLTLGSYILKPERLLGALTVLDDLFDVNAAVEEEKPDAGSTCVVFIVHGFVC